MIHLRKPTYYWLQHLLCSSTMVTELSCPSPAHITFYFALPYLTIICHNNKLHVLGCLQSLPLVLSKKPMKVSFYSQPWYNKVLARGNTQCLRFSTFYQVFTTCKFVVYSSSSSWKFSLQNLSGFDHREQESGAKSLSTFQLSAVETFELSFLTGEYPL